MNVAIITEGLQGTGYGHLTRCLSIYQAFEENNITPLYIVYCDEERKKFIPNVNMMQLNWIDKTDELIEQIKDYDIVVIDSYLATLEIYKKIYKSVKKTVYIDDYVRLNYPPGIIVNGTIDAENLPFKKDDKHKYLLGIKYMPLRKEFWDVEIPERSNDEIQNVLITFGGQDIRNLTPIVLDYLLKEFPKFNYHVVLGSKNSIIEKEKDNISYYYLLNAEEILKVMLKCDLAITSAGQTIYELARLAIKTIAIGIIENQKYNIRGWIKRKFINEEIWFNDKLLLRKLDKNIKLFSDDYTTSKNLIDGHGSRRLVNYDIN